MIEKIIIYQKILLLIKQHIEHDKHKKCVFVPLGYILIQLLHPLIYKHHA